MTTQVICANLIDVEQLNEFAEFVSPLGTNYVKILSKSARISKLGTTKVQTLALSQLATKVKTKIAKFATGEILKFATPTLRDYAIL